MLPAFRRNLNVETAGHSKTLGKDLQVCMDFTDTAVRTSCPVMSTHSTGGRLRNIPGFRSQSGARLCWLFSWFSTYPETIAWVSTSGRLLSCHCTFFLFHYWSAVPQPELLTGSLSKSVKYKLQSKLRVKPHWGCLIPSVVSLTGDLRYGDFGSRVLFKIESITFWWRNDLRHELTMTHSLENC